MNIINCMGTALADTKTSFDPSYELMTASCGLTIVVFLGCSRALASTTYYWPVCSSNSWGRHFEPMSHSDLHQSRRQRGRNTQGKIRSILILPNDWTYIINCALHLIIVARFRPRNTFAKKPLGIRHRWVAPELHRHAGPLTRLRGHETSLDEPKTLNCTMGIMGIECLDRIFLCQ